MKFKSGNTWMRFPLKDIQGEWSSIRANYCEYNNRTGMYMCVRACVCVRVLFMIMYNLYNHIYILVLKSI